MAKKPAVKTAETQTAKPAQPGQEKKIGFMTLKHWATGTVNQTGQPILIIEAEEGAHFGVRLTAKHAGDIATALAALVKPQTGTSN